MSTKTSAEKQREYYAANREKKRAYFREWEAKSKARRKANPSRSRAALLAVNRKWTEKNRHRHKGYMLKYRYGMTLEQFDRLYAEQDGACAICADPLPKAMKACVDHCHETDVVRGLLCRTCNIGIGYFKDSPAMLAKAFMYLTKHKQIGEVA